MEFMLVEYQKQLIIIENLFICKYHRVRLYYLKKQRKNNGYNPDRFILVERNS
jgi:hypothetical protein